MAEIPEAAVRLLREEILFRNLPPFDSEELETRTRWAEKVAREYLEKVLPAIAADLRERLLGDRAIQAAHDALADLLVSSALEEVADAVEAALDAIGLTVNSQPKSPEQFKDSDTDVNSEEANHG